MTLERLAHRAAAELRYRSAALVFALPCWLWIHSKRHGRCRWCRQAVPL